MSADLPVSPELRAVINDPDGCLVAVVEFHPAWPEPSLLSTAAPGQLVTALRSVLARVEAATLRPPKAGGYRWVDQLNEAEETQ